MSENKVHNCRPGEYSSFVSGMQYLLKENGYWAQGTGLFDLGTSDWLNKFQNDRSILESELCNEVTWTELYNEKKLKLRDRGYAVRAMQFLLQANGYYIETNEVFDADTYYQLIKFQSERGLPESGRCDMITWSELIREK